MINGNPPTPLSMKTTPRLFERFPSGNNSSPFSSKVGGTTIYQDRAKDGYSSVPLVLLLEWSDLRGLAPDGGTF